jgi:hypothetical protein
VRERAHASDKDVFWTWCRVHGIYEHACLVGHPATEGVLTRQLLADIESLLIFHLQPLWNSQNTRTRGISRPGMVVTCTGDWRWSSTFFDN